MDVFVEVKYMQGPRGPPKELPPGVHPATASLRDASNNVLGLKPESVAECGARPEYGVEDLEPGEVADDSMLRPQQEELAKSHLGNGDVRHYESHMVDKATQTDIIAVTGVSNHAIAAGNDAPLATEERRRSRNRARKRAKHRLRQRRRMEEQGMETRATLPTGRYYRRRRRHEQDHRP
ncbi:hypothetical protein KEM54_000196 [Ascosphaera aggregata]|nr:hypothetical protein KEM54_000196 [Ascosphaera aggregata]